MTSKARRARWAKPVAGIALVGVLSALPALAGCAGVDTANAADATLERFTTCAALTDYAQGKAREIVGPYGLGGGVITLAARSGGVEAMTAQASPSAAASDAAGSGVAGQDFSTTNVQEAGVDEPDIVKSDGTRVFAIARNRLYAIDASGPVPRIAGSLALPANTYARDMLLSGNRLLVMGDGMVDVRPLPAPGAQPPAGGEPDRLMPIQPGIVGQGGSLLMQVDVTDAAAMRITETLQTEARYVSARLTGTTARVVVAAGGPMGIAFTAPTQPGAEDEALRANRAALSRTTADNWLPRYSVTSATGTSAPQPLVACDAVSRPPVFSGLDTLTVLTVDLTGGLTPIDTDAVMASGENVYASPQGLYVATNRWAVPDAQGRVTDVDTTQVHKFETSSSSQTTYRGSGNVIGHTLNQFSMSEHEGRLRIATTNAALNVVGDDAVAAAPAPGTGSSESYVTVMEERDGKLATLGQVGGLGRGERIFAVRFIGATGYVVTFRQTDPLYTVDLSDPAAPRVAGELKIAGYSAYLHPIGDNLLIGVGQDATQEGRTTGLQMSLFDVSDQGSPKRIQNAVLPGASSDAEWDHRAFLWWPATSLAVVPYQRGLAVTDVPAIEGDVAVGAPVQQGFEAGALGLRVTRDAITEAGRVSHPSDPQFGQGVRRSLVVGDSLLTLSDAGVKASALADLTERAWVPFT